MRLGDDSPTPTPEPGDRPLWFVIFVSSFIVLVCMWASEAQGRIIVEEPPVRDIVAVVRPLTVTRLRHSFSPQAGTATPHAAPATPEGDGWSTCRASWYGEECFGNSTADGTYYDEDAWGVAHRSLPMGTLVEITYDGVTVTAPVFDRGPFVAGRTFDLSAAVARSLGFSGVQTISYRVVAR